MSQTYVPPVFTFKIQGLITMVLIEMIINWSIYIYIYLYIYLILKDTKMMSQNDITQKNDVENWETEPFWSGFMALVFFSGLVQTDRESWPILFLNDDGPVRYDLLPEILGKRTVL